jgi:hypothetical protein
MACRFCSRRWKGHPHRHYLPRIKSSKPSEQKQPFLTLQNTAMQPFTLPAFSRARTGNTGRLLPVGPGFKCKQTGDVFFDDVRRSSIEPRRVIEMVSISASLDEIDPSTKMTSTQIF